MGEGLNLQKFADRWPGGANHAIMLDRWWNNARDEQCIKRIYRQGASMDMPVFVYDLYCKGSIDYFVKDLSDRKKRAFDQVTESEEIRPAADWRDYLGDLL